MAEVKLMRIATGMIAVVAAATFALPAMADFYVVKEGGKCSVVETAGDAKPTTGKFGEKYSSQADAEKGMAENPHCRQQ
jgi:hypothetical protein